MNLVVTGYLLTLVVVDQATVAYLVGEIADQGHRAAYEPNFMFFGHAF